MSFHCVLIHDGNKLIGFKRRNTIVENVKHSTVYSSPSAAKLACTTGKVRYPTYVLSSMLWKEALAKYSDGIDPARAQAATLLGLTNPNRDLEIGNRLDELMRHCRENNHQVTYADLVTLKEGS